MKSVQKKKKVNFFYGFAPYWFKYCCLAGSRHMPVTAGDSYDLTRWLMNLNLPHLVDTNYCFLQSLKSRNRMKKIFLAFLFPLFLSGCVKEVIHGIDEAKNQEKITGTWYLKKIEPVNNQPALNGLHFLYGQFIFQANSTFGFNMVTGESYQGTWLMSSREAIPDCYTSANGSEICIPKWNRLLDLDALQVNGQQRKTATFEYLSFQTDTRFTALIYVGFSGYRYYFEKKK